MAVSQRVVLLSMILCVANAWGQPNRREPHIGYLYPSGGQRGSSFEITVGGQFLRGANEVYVSGQGVRASVIKHCKPLRNLQKEQREAIHRRLKELGEKRWAELEKDGHAGPMPPWLKKLIRGGKAGPGATKKKNVAKKKNATEKEPVTLPDHPLLHDLENKSLRELHHVVYELLRFNKKKQPNAQIAESVLIEVTIAPKAAPGDRELRIKSPAGLTNPMIFQVGQLPETCELEPNDPRPLPILLPAPPIDLPLLLNGQIQPGDVDRFRFRAKRGQQLVIETQARHLIPYLADAVPGWFQATLALYDDKGNEVAFADDYRFDPDPVLFYEIPENGEYELEIRDSIYRGREDFVYRIAVSEQPFITQAFPLGGRTGVKTAAVIDGWNLSRKRLPLNTKPPFHDGIRQTALRQNKRLSNQVTYAVGALPECRETEPNDTPQNAQRIGLPRIVNGRIAQPGDVDVFQFKSRAGEQVVAEVFGRRLRSPLDSLLRLTNASGRVLAWNDDHEDQETGLLTHCADSYVHTRLPESGVYYVHLADSQRHGGEAYCYRLRIGSPRPDFALRVTPSSINMHAGRATPLCVHAVRKDGFDGDIEVVLKDAPAGFRLSGGRIPAGRDQVRMTLTAPWKPIDQPVVLQMEGRALIGRRQVSRPAVPAEDMMQAFLYRHLVPSQELMVAVMGRRRGPPIELADGGPVRVPAGGTAQVRIRTPRRPKLRDIQFELREPPEGVTLHEVTVGPDGLALVLKADGDTAQVGLADNLIVEAFAEMAGRQRGGESPKPKRRVSLGVLPAIPFEIVQ